MSPCALCDVANVPSQTGNMNACERQPSVTTLLISFCPVQVEGSAGGASGGIANVFDTHDTQDNRDMELENLLLHVSSCMGQIKPLSRMHLDLCGDGSTIA